MEYHQAIANMRAAFPGADVEEWLQQQDGTWVSRLTGESRDTQP